MIYNWTNFEIKYLLNESKLQFTENFGRVLELMPDNRIKSSIIDLKNTQKDIPLTQNYLDISPNKDEITFISDRKAQQIIQENPTVWRTNGNLPSSKYLTFNKNTNGDFKNSLIFSGLGFTPQEPISENHPVPGAGVEGEIVTEMVSPTSGKTFVLFKWKLGGVDKLIVLNKTGIDEVSSTQKKLYSQSRNSIRIGRFINTLMSSVELKVTPKEVEDFANQWKSAWDMYNDVFLKFDIVSGYEIQKWYSESNYESDKSSLGGSCMRYEECSEYFGIYTENSDVVKLVILYSDKGGELKNGKFVSRYIKGRALLWKTNQGDMFMDRIYTNNDSDVELFKQFAEKQGWWCKQIQNSNNHFTAQRGSSFKDPSYSVDLKWADHEYYPYVDTLSYLRLNELDSRDASGTLTNDSDLISPQYQLRDTEGDREAY